MYGKIIGNTASANWIILTYPAGYSCTEVQADMETMLTTGIGYGWRGWILGPGGGLAVSYAAIQGGT